MKRPIIPRMQTRDINGTTAMSSSSSSSHRVLWQSPMTYLFGGLAAMLGFIALALLILACSYCKASRSERRRSRRDLESDDHGDEKKVEVEESVKDVYGEHILVIMAGEERPTLLARPVSCAVVVSPLGECGSCSSSSSNFDDGENGKEKEVAGSISEKVKSDVLDHDGQTRETSDHHDVESLESRTHEEDTGVS